MSKELAANEKLALFCEAYKRHRGHKYKANGKHGNMLRPYPLTTQILEHYFTSENWYFKGKHSVPNLVRYWNELQDEMRNGSAQGFPNEWSQAYERSLKPEQLPQYWAHLRALDLEP